MKEKGKSNSVFSFVHLLLFIYPFINDRSWIDRVASLSEQQNGGMRESRDFPGEKSIRGSLENDVVCLIVQ